MTKEKLLECLEHLTVLIDEWNESPDPEDRGNSNDALCLLLWDDGSGRVGTVYQAPEKLNEQLQFDNIEGLADYLMDWIGD